VADCVTREAFLRIGEELTKLAQQRGHAETSHIAWIGKAGWKDWELKLVILDGDWPFVTKNSVDFRGPTGAPGSKGQYADVVRLTRSLQMVTQRADPDPATQAKLATAEITRGVILQSSSTSD
jgi:hypothetical protein